LIGYTWIMKQGYQSDRPALHIVEPVVLNCPSGPFRSEFLMSSLFFHYELGDASGHGEEE
jgi:hypothetical protein